MPDARHLAHRPTEFLHRLHLIECCPERVGSGADRFRGGMAGKLGGRSGSFACASRGLCDLTQALAFLSNGLECLAVLIAGLAGLFCQSPETLSFDSGRLRRGSMCLAAVLGPVQGISMGWHWGTVLSIRVRIGRAQGGQTHQRRARRKAERVEDMMLLSDDVGVCRPEQPMKVTPDIVAVLGEFAQLQSRSTHSVPAVVSVHGVTLMQRHVKVLFVCFVLGFIFLPSLARAETFISPFAGATFGNNSGNGRVAVGLDAGWLAAGIFGFEADFGYVPDFFGDKGRLGANSVMDAMGNLIVGIPAGGTRGGGLHPYLTVGAGLLRTKLDGVAGTTSSMTNNEVGMNAGVGATAYFADHVGIRGDVRYFRNLTDNSSFNDANLDFGGFHFWRASVGIVWRP